MTTSKRKRGTSDRRPPFKFTENDFPFVSY